MSDAACKLAREIAMLLREWYVGSNSEVTEISLEDDGSVTIIVTTTTKTGVNSKCTIST
jgi:hypothetical protein